MTTFIVTVHKLFNGIIPQLSQRQELQIDALTAEDAAMAARDSMGQDGWVVTNTEILGGPESENAKSAEATASVAGRAISHAANVIVERDARIKRLENVAKRARAKRRKVEKALNELEAKHSNLIEKAAAIDIENQKLRREIQEHESNREELLIERTKLREMIDAYKRENRDLTQRNSQGYEQVTELKAINQTKERQIYELADERDDALAKNRELVKENADARDMYRAAQQQIDDLIHEKPVEPQEPMGDDWGKEMWEPQLGEDEELTVDTLLGQALGAASMCWRTAPTGVFWSEKANWVLDGVKHHLKHNIRQRTYKGPMKPVEALVKEQDDDAQLWALAFSNQFDLPDDDDMAVTSWFANAMMTAVDKYRNKKTDFIGWTAAGREVPKPEGWENPFQYAQRLQAHLQEFVNELLIKIQPALDAIEPMVAGKVEYPGWQKTGYQTEEEYFEGERAKDCGWSVAQNLAEKTAGKDRL